MSCHGIDCANTKLVSAHIIPKGFARFIRSGDEPLLRADANGVADAYPMLGETDSEILCQTCDQALGKNDQYAIDVCRQFKDAKDAEYFEDTSVDADRFSKFILSVIWRASISKRGRYSGVVTLGPLEKAAREIIFDRRPITDLPALKVIVSRLFSKKHDVVRVITDPTRFKFERLNAYNFILAGFRICAVIDGQKLPQDFDELLINHTGTFRGVYLPFDDLPEHRRLIEIFSLN